LKLIYQSWEPEAAPDTVLAIVHGFGEHSGRYANLVDRLVPRGHAIYALDLRGHGRSPGQRGHINTWAEYRGDVQAFLRATAGDRPDCPRFLVGHSMGALIVLDYVIHEPESLAGVVSSGTPIDPVGVAKPHLVAIARLLSRVWPTVPMDTGLEAAALSRDPEVVRAYEEDPLVHSTATVRWGTESLRSVERIKAHATEVTVPLLMIHGESDRLAAVNGARAFFEQVASTDK
jgi:alpha-beta hydrolase superfamily lysophospholipase